MSEEGRPYAEQRAAVEGLTLGGATLRCGDAVRLSPRPGGDAMDTLLAGRTAIIQAIEQDYEGHIHVGVVLDDDPGLDLGMLRQPGHRFFFSPEELHPISAVDSGQGWAVDSPRTARPPRILVAGIGNIFLGDDGFGVQVARVLAAAAQPPGVRVIDFGIRALDLAYALCDGYDHVVLIDASPRGGTPGSLYVIQPDASALTSAHSLLDGHNMSPVHAIRAAQKMGARLDNILIVGCEPDKCHAADTALSRPVEAAVEPAAELVREILERIGRGQPAIEVGIDSANRMNGNAACPSEG